MVLGIQPKTCEVGKPMSLEVNRARLIIVQEISRLMEAGSGERTAG